MGPGTADRIPAWLLPGVLSVGAVALAVSAPMSLSLNGLKDLPWVAGTVVFVGSATLVMRKRPQHPVARWFALSAGLFALIQALDPVTLSLQRSGSVRTLAWVLLGYQFLIVAFMCAVTRLFGLFPGGRPEARYERRTLGALWWLLALPPLVFLGRPTLLVPNFHALGAIRNPYHVPALSAVGTVAGVGVALVQAVFVVGVVLLVRRYRRSDDDDRRRIRWLLLPTLFAGAGAIDFAAWGTLGGGTPGSAAEGTLTLAWILSVTSSPVAIAVSLLRPDLLDVDRIIRKSLVYGLLWTLIAVVYIGAAAGLGLVAGSRFSLGSAIVLTVLATVLFNPARQRLERLADQWVFGKRMHPTQLISDLGAALEETVELERLLPRMAETLQEGLALRWARVRLEPAPPLGDEKPALSVPIVLGEERLGVVECGPKRVGSLSAEDEAVVRTLARQAALAVRNVRLTAELERSRVRLVRAQDAERRRIERNIHDGVQQDLVALAAFAADVRSQLERDLPAASEALRDLQSGLRRVIGDLRELARGIHPSLLSDRGLLEAVEALAARSAIPVSVRADPSLRGQRFAEEIEGAGYFAVAEALANVGKHATASRAEVSLAKADGVLSMVVRDDGVGFDPAIVGGEGLANLAERLAALGGRLDVDSALGRGTTVTAQLRVDHG